FAGKITKWNDPKITADNSGANLPSSTIQVVHRSDASGTTSVFTSYMTKVAPSIWTAGASKDVKWPTGQGAKGSDGVTAQVKSTPGSVGYAEVSYAKANSLGTAEIKNASGNFVGPTTAGVQAAVNAAQVPDDLKVVMDYAATGSDVYPI